MYHNFLLWTLYIIILTHTSLLQYVKSETAITVFELLMMGGLSPETCWAIKKQWNNKFYYTVASCWFFLWDLYYDARIHEQQDAGTNFSQNFEVKKKPVKALGSDTKSQVYKPYSLD